MAAITCYDNVKCILHSRPPACVSLNLKTQAEVEFRFLLSLLGLWPLGHCDSLTMN